MTLVPISELRKIHPHLEEARVRAYEEALRRGEPIGPIKVYEPAMIVLDGNHRVEAARRVGYKEVDAKLVGAALVTLTTSAGIVLASLGELLPMDVWPF